jgi:prephenate dehydrogenase
MTVPTNIETLGIVGYGQFGAFVARLAEHFAPRVRLRVSSGRFAPDGERFFALPEVAACDLVVLSVPIRAFAATVERIAPLLGPESLLVDVATVKVHTGEVLRRHLEGKRYLASHPMFGPYSFEKRGHSLEGLRMVLTETSLEPESYAAVKAALGSVGLTVLEMSPEAHDRMLAETLFLTHYVGQIVHQGDFDRTSIDSVSFGFLMDAVESVRQDVGLFQDVYRFNPFCREVVARFEAAEQKVARILEQGT